MGLGVHWFPLRLTCHFGWSCAICSVHGHPQQRGAHQMHQCDRQRGRDISGVRVPGRPFAQHEHHPQSMRQGCAYAFKARPAQLGMTGSTFPTNACPLQHVHAHLDSAPRRPLAYTSSQTATMTACSTTFARTAQAAVCAAWRWAAIRFAIHTPTLTLPSVPAHSLVCGPLQLLAPAPLHGNRRHPYHTAAGNPCNGTCASNGYCNFTTSRCQCLPGYAGDGRASCTRSMFRVPLGHRPCPARRSPVLVSPHVRCCTCTAHSCPASPLPAPVAILQCAGVCVRARRL